MMTSDEIKAATERLERLCEEKAYLAQDVMRALIGKDYPDQYDSIGMLKALLRQADPDTHIKLPKDADGITLHVGDSVYARRKDATHGHYYYFNGMVESIEFEKDETYVYVTAEDEDGDQFNTRELHHGSHTPTSGQIVENLVGEAFNLGADKGRANEKYSSTAWEARKELVKRFTEQLKPLLSDDAE